MGIYTAHPRRKRTHIECKDVRGRLKFIPGYNISMFPVWQAKDSRHMIFKYHVIRDADWPTKLYLQEFPSRFMPFSKRIKSALNLLPEILL